MSEETRRLAVYGCVVEVLKQEAKNWPTSVSEETGLVCDLGLDSISIITVVMDLEGEFDIEICDDKMEGMKTIGDVVDLVLSTIGERDVQVSA